MVVFRLFLLKNGIFSKKNVFFLFCLQLVSFQRFSLLFFVFFSPFSLFFPFPKNSLIFQFLGGF
jgi:hypothetical protein